MSDPVLLADGEVYAVGNVGSGDQLAFYIDVPSGAFLLVETEGDAGDLDLYVKRGSVPTTSSYDARSESSSASESCVVSAPTPDRYYILLYGYSAASGVTVVATLDPELAGTPVAADVLAYDQFGDPASFFTRGSDLGATPVLTTTSDQQPIAVFTPRVQSADGCAEFTASLYPPVYTGLTNQIMLCGTTDDELVPGYSEISNSPIYAPFTNVDLAFFLTINNPISPAAGYPSSGSFGTLATSVLAGEGVASRYAAAPDLAWGEDFGQFQYNMRVQMKVVLTRAPQDLGNGTWLHRYVVAMAGNTGGEPSYSSARCSFWKAVLPFADPVKTFALLIHPVKTYNNQAVENFSDPSAADDPALYLRAATLSPLTASAPAPAPAPDPFWTNFVGCTEAA